MRLAILAAVVVAAGGSARADRDPAFAGLERALPSGWSLIVTDAELVIRHDRPSYVVGAAASPVVTLELRYHLQPKWTAEQLAAARATNERIAAELREQRAKYRIDDPPKPAVTADDRARLAAYEKAAAQSSARLVKLPLCTLGDASMFDGPDTYAQLALRIDPVRVQHEAQRIADLVKTRCGAS